MQVADVLQCASPAFVSWQKPVPVRDEPRSILIRTNANALVVFFDCPAHSNVFHSGIQQAVGRYDGGLRFVHGASSLPALLLCASSVNAVFCVRAAARRK